MKKYIFFIIFALVFGGCSLIGEAKAFSYRWFYLSANLKDPDQLARFGNIAQSAARHGLNGVVLYAGPDATDFDSPGYLKRLRQIKKICDESRLEIIPILFSEGYGSLISFDKNLAEGIPVKGASFQVKNSKAIFISDSQTKLNNGGFEHFRGNVAAGFQLQDNPGKTSFIDTQIRQDGRVSLRFETFSGSRNGMGRIMQKIDVKPETCYRLTCYVRTENLLPRNCFFIQLYGDDGRIINTAQPTLSTRGEWQKIRFGFNSLNYQKVKLYLGVWEGKSGRFWVDGLSVEPVALINILRRPGTPVTIRNSQNGTIYDEGRDYAPITDPSPGFDFDHESPDIEILPNSRIHNGDVLSVDYYHGMNVTSGQITQCMSEPEVYALWEKQAVLIDRELKPEKYFLSMDEIRAGGTCMACRSRNISMAQILGDCVTRQVKILRKINPRAGIFIWSDMLDPHMNARNNYYLVDGDFSGSWNFIPKDLVMVCWNYSTRNESLGHFSGLGFKTMGAVYYDTDLNNIKDWIASLDAASGSVGIMYTTWQNKYDLLNIFGDMTAPEGIEK